MDYHHIETLDWDTSFFGFPVGRLNVLNGFVLDETWLINISSMFHLLYIFSPIPLSLNESSLQIKKVDTKVILYKELNLNLIADEIVEFDPYVHNYSELLNLAYLSGKYSRFNSDLNFPPGSFQRLYKQWLNKSIADSNDSVIVSCENGRIKGFVSVEIASSKSLIGLLAVDSGFQGRGVASELLRKAEIATLQAGLGVIEVATQEANLPAIGLYLKNDYTVKEKTFVYHYWNI